MDSATVVLEDVLGEITDLDSHELIPTCLWPETFGDVGTASVAIVPADIENRPNSPAHIAWQDGEDVTAENVWLLRPRVKAPGAIDLERRVEVLDFMGVQRQLVFPGFGLCGFSAFRRDPAELAATVGVEPHDLGLFLSSIITAHNDWALRQTAVSPDRLRLVGVLMSESLPELIAEAERLLAGGIRALWLPASHPPGGKSPAAHDLDTLWSMFEEADACALNHLGGEAGFYDATSWRAGVSAFEGATTLETKLDPYSFATTSIAPSHFLLTMVLGGVFERHPNLRFGSIEAGAGWLGPLAESLDMWAQKSSLTKTLSLKPSQYISRNVRVTPYYFEPVDKYIERYGLEDVYCYSSDYPHVEGGKSPKEDFAKNLAPLGPEMAQKFFVTNGQYLMPSL